MAERRRFGRRRQELMSNLGPILDLSRGGAMVLSRKRVDGGVTLQLQTEDGPFEINANVVHQRRQGFWRFELGLEFGAISEDEARRLTEISSTYAFSPGLTG